MGRGKEPEVPLTDPAEAKKYRDEAAGHLKSGNYQLSSATLDKLSQRGRLEEFRKCCLVSEPLFPIKTSAEAAGEMSTLEPDTAMAQARSILGPSKENEFLQSFVRVGIGDDEEEPVQKDSISKRAPPAAEKATDKGDEADKLSSQAGDHKASFKNLQKRMSKKKKVRRREEEVYTDKDRAAAVVMGSRDIKQSLSMKDKAERSLTMHLPEEADAGTMLALTRSEIRAGRHASALQFADKALELSPDDKQALVARSRCRLLLGDARAALADAEAALALDQNFVKAVYQKAEALYYSGEFEHSLMFYHRGRRMRPDLQGFRLGIQKAQEAIENSIGASTPPEAGKKPKGSKPVPKTSRPLTSQLMVDKLYLESLLRHPDLNIAERRNSAVARQAEEAIRFLENRQEFWRQQTSSRH